MMDRRGITWSQVCDIALGFPGVEVTRYYGYPALKVRGRFMAGTKVSGTLVLTTDFENRDLLLRADPDTFYLTDHYRNYESVLVRLSHVTHEQLAELLEDAWRRAAPRELVDAFDAETDDA